MEALLETKIFKVSVERLLLNGGQTLYMVGIALLIGTVIGTLLALVLVLCRKGGLVENKVLHSIVSLYINVVRSVPFIILLVTIMPLTRAILGTTIGSTAALVPLVVYISPYLARLIENSLLEVSPGILEAAQAMGDTCNVHSMHCLVLKNWQTNVKRRWERKPTPAFCIPTEQSVWVRIWTQRLR